MIHLARNAVKQVIFNRRGIPASLLRITPMSIASVETALGTIFSKAHADFAAAQKIANSFITEVDKVAPAVEAILALFNPSASAAVTASVTLANTVQAGINSVGAIAETNGATVTIPASLVTAINAVKAATK